MGSDSSLGRFISWTADFGEAVFLWPFFSVVTTVSGVIAGVLGSLFDHELLNAPYPWFWPGTTLAAGPSAFWAVASGFAICFGGTFWAQARASKRSTTDLQTATADVARDTEALRAATGDVAKNTIVLRTQSERLDRLVRQLFTLPPRGFLESYRDVAQLVAESRQACMTAINNGNDRAESIRATIQVVLNCILTLSGLFFEDMRRCRFGVNVMLYLPTEEIQRTRSVEAIQRRLHFTEKNVSVLLLAGVLDLRPDLSVATGSDFEPDERLVPELALPIPSMTDGERRLRKKDGVLPGAPEAFLLREEVVVQSPDELLSMAGADQFTSAVRQALDDYFRKANIGSFVSVPLFGSAAEYRMRLQPIGILNIHWDIPNSSAATRQEMFSPLLTPIVLELGRLVWTYRNLSSIMTV